MGLEPMTSAIPVHCYTNWAIMGSNPVITNKNGKSHLLNVNLFRCVLTERKPRERGSIPLYHGGGMSSLVRSRVNFKTA